MVFSTSQDDSKLVVEALRIARPTYSVDSYLVEGKNNLMFTRLLSFAGYLDVFSPTVILFIGTTCAPLFPAFLLFFALRRKASFFSDVEDQSQKVIAVYSVNQS